jgi:REP element-mobilizing transposase RayT
MTRPVRKFLPHQPPLSVRSDKAVFFLTVCCQPRGKNQLCLPATAKQLLDSIAFLHERGDWWIELALLLPDHLHALAHFPSAQSMETVVKEWKKYTARAFKISWQRDFFDHRLRHDESLRDKADYILANPVRAGLVTRAEDWPYVWMPER